MDYTRAWFLFWTKNGIFAHWRDVNAQKPHKIGDFLVDPALIWGKGATQGRAQASRFPGVPVHQSGVRELRGELPCPAGSRWKPDQRSENKHKLLHQAADPLRFAPRNPVVQL